MGSYKSYLPGKNDVKSTNCIKSILENGVLDNIQNVQLQIILCSRTFQSFSSYSNKTKTLGVFVSFNIG